MLACSALKQAYRDVLVKRVPEHRIVYLELSRAAAERRLEGRRGTHEIVRDYDKILDGQYRDLEPPAQALTILRWSSAHARSSNARRASSGARATTESIRRQRLVRDPETACISDAESEARVVELLNQLGELKRVLLPPPGLHPPSIPAQAF